MSELALSIDSKTLGVGKEAANPLGVPRAL